MFGDVTVACSDGERVSLGRESARVRLAGGSASIHPGGTFNLIRDVRFDSRTVRLWMDASSFSPTLSDDLGILGRDGYVARKAARTGTYPRPVFDVFRDACAILSAATFFGDSDTGELHPSPLPSTFPRNPRRQIPYSRSGRPLLSLPRIPSPLLFSSPLLLFSVFPFSSLFPL